MHQDLYPQALRHWGVKAGASFANQSYEYQDEGFSISPDRRWGFDLGVFAEFLTLPTISILGELHYVQKGSTFEVAVTGPDSPYILGFATADVRDDYLSIPLMAKLRLESDQFIPYFVAGPRLDILIGQARDPEQSTADYVIPEAGATFGLGAEFLLEPPTALIVEVRYAPNFTNAYEGEFVDIRNESLEMLVGFAW
jgi:hypothetical protein